MKKLKEILSSSKVNAAAFVLASVLVLTASIGAARAAIAYFYPIPSMYEIGVSLLENGEKASWRGYSKALLGDGWNASGGELLGDMLSQSDGQLSLGKAYTENLNVHNSGSTGQYVRVCIDKYWVDEKTGEKQMDLDPSYIDLHLLLDDGTWIEDETACGSGRTVLYYGCCLPTAEETPAFADTLTITKDLIAAEGRDDVSYSGAKFCVDVRVEAVQETNAADAVRSAWSSNVVIEIGLCISGEGGVAPMKGSKPFPRAMFRLFFRSKII